MNFVREILETEDRADNRERSENVSECDCEIKMHPCSLLDYHFGDRPCIIDACRRNIGDGAGNSQKNNERP
jgi:hypothetical protein